MTAKYTASRVRLNTRSTAPAGAVGSRFGSAWYSRTANPRPDSARAAAGSKSPNGAMRCRSWRNPSNRSMRAWRS